LRGQTRLFTINCIRRVGRGFLHGFRLRHDFVKVLVARDRNLPLLILTFDKDTAAANLRRYFFFDSGKSNFRPAIILSGF
jgi:hypothetical protein